MGFYTKVRGVTFENDGGVNRQSLIPLCRVGQSLALIKDLQNAYDFNAIAVYTFEGDQLGFLSSDLSQQFDEEGWAIKDWTAIVHEITGGTEDKPSFGLNIYVCKFKELE